jgi:hypothetical protein
MRRKWIRRCLGFLGIVFLLLVGLTALSYSRGVPTVPWTARLGNIELTVPFRTWEEHDTLYPQGDDSYVLELARGTGSLVYFGAKHSRDPGHPRRRRIERAWEKLRPTIAFHEGRSRGFLIGPLYERLVGLPEPALVHQLARRADVPLYSLEPPYEHEVAELLHRWSPDQVALYFTMRVYWSEAQGRADDGLAADLLTKRTDTPALRGSLESVADIDRLWKRDFPGHPDWRTLTQEPEGTYLVDMSEASRLVRGRHMVRVLVDQVRRGERVFAVVGCSHVIRQEPTIRVLLDTDVGD